MYALPDAPMPPQELAARKQAALKLQQEQIREMKEHDAAKKTRSKHGSAPSGPMHTSFHTPEKPMGG